MYKTSHFFLKYCFSLQHTRNVVWRNDAEQINDIVSDIVHGWVSVYWSLKTQHISAWYINKILPIIIRYFKSTKFRQNFQYWWNPNTKCSYSEYTVNRGNLCSFLSFVSRQKPINFRFKKLIEMKFGKNVIHKLSNMKWKL